MTGEMADRAAYAARVAWRDGQLERAAHLIATAMGLDPRRRDLWELHARQVIALTDRQGCGGRSRCGCWRQASTRTTPDCSRRSGTTRHPESEC